MGLGVRLFFVEDDDRLKSISLKRFERLIQGRNDAKPFPEYAGCRIRYVLVVLEVVDRKPVSITGTDCAIVKFDNDGQVNSEERDRENHYAAELMNSFLTKPQQGSVIDARQLFIKKRYANEYCWQPSSEIKEAISEEIFGRKKPPLKLV